MCLRDVSDEDKEKLLLLLKECQLEYRTEIMASGQFMFYSNIDYLTCFLDSLVVDIVEKCAYLFCLGDILELGSVWSIHHAKIILRCLQNVFSDTSILHDDDVQLAQCMDVMEL